MHEINIQRALTLEKLGIGLVKMYREVATWSPNIKETAVQEHNSKTHVRLVSISVGDYILMTKRMAKGGHGLRLQCRGLQAIIRLE